MTPYGSAVYSIARQRAEQTALDAGKAIPSESELHAIGLRADALNTYGHDAVQKSDGTWVQQGIGSENNPSANSFAALRRYEGQAAWERAVREQWRKNPAIAKKLGLPQPQRAGA
jgi:hypothetical protein